jgi:D-sedoheptulose 7-phosphate isomerase
MENRVRSFLEQELREAARVIDLVLNDRVLQERLLAVADACIEAVRRGNKIMFAGNGGSAADAQHFAAELVGRFYHERAAIPALSLNADTSILTAIGNDYGFEKIFSRQVEANGRAGDVFVGISTSGSSRNVIEAAQQARKMGISTVCLVGMTPCDLENVSDYCIRAPSDSTPRIQEVHTVLGHVLCMLIEKLSDLA